MQDIFDLFDSKFIVSTLRFFYIITIAYLLFLILMENHAPIKTIAWILTITLIPYLGIIFFLVFGSKFRKKYIFKKKRKLELKRTYNELIKCDSETHSIIQNKITRQKKTLIKISSMLPSSKISKYNEIDIYNNGTQFYHSLLKDMKQAKYIIFLEFYIFENGVIADKIKDILIDKSKQGVKVYLLYDGLGSIWLEKEYINDLKNNKVCVSPFLPVWLPKPFRGINYRNHRKITIVDSIAYMGGMNISDKYIMHGKNFWRDTHLRICGESVDTIKKTFIGDWNFASKRKIQYSQKPEIQHNKGTTINQVLISGPDLGYQNIKMAFFHAISTAKKNIYITTPYFMPDESILSALSSVALAGVDIKIILPETSDSKIVDACSRSYIQELLNYGIKIYFYKKGFIHSKVMLIDGSISSIGSANIDYRSFYQNMEITTIIYDREFYQKMFLQFQKDLKKSESILLENWMRRSKSKFIIEAVARLFAPVF